MTSIYWTKYYVTKKTMSSDSDIKTKKDSLQLCRESIANWKFRKKV